MQENSLWKMFAPLFLLFGVALSLLFMGTMEVLSSNRPVLSGLGTFYVDGLKGNDSNSGSASKPWQTLDHALKNIHSGDTLILGDGIYLVQQIRFGPAGAGPDRRTVFKAAPHARAIITTPADLPPPVQMDDYVRIEGLWLGGARKKKDAAIILGGGPPIGEGKQIVNCTLFGYREISQGTTEYTLYQGNRFVHDGLGRFEHPIYISGGYNKGAMAQHTIVDDNIFVAGEGYSIHGWHHTHSNIITRNFVEGHYWGLVLDGSDHVVANNFFWKQTGQPGREPPWGPWLPGSNVVFVNNIMGPKGGMGPGGISPGNKLTNNAFLETSPVGEGAITLTRGEERAQLGVSEQEIDGAIAALDQAFSQPVESIYADRTIEPSFLKLRLKIPRTSPLYRAGRAWFDLNLRVNLGPDSPAPTDEGTFWAAFRAAGLRDFDRFGEVK